jgi:TetR/AcrR family transcriptional repressor of nem operon
MVRRDPKATRQKLLEAAFHAFYEQGFQGTGLDDVLARTDVTKGALYHHFANKMELGYAVVQEMLRPWMLRQWVDPLGTSGDPVSEILATQRAILGHMDEHQFHMGCPVNNLTQEMASVDEGFRLRLEALMQEWRSAIAKALDRGRAAGTVREDVDPEATAAFLVAAWEGMSGTGKTSRDRNLMRSMGSVMESFLETLRPQPSTVPG